MQREWLTEEIGFQDADDELRAGGLAAPWASLMAQRREGDRLFAFSSPARSWEMLAGRAGYALVRDGEIVDSLVTMMN